MCIYRPISSPLLCEKGESVRYSPPPQLSSRHMHQVPACPIVVSAHSSCQLNTHVSEKISREVFSVTYVMDIGNLEAIISGQEKVITQLEQELHHLQSAQNTETGVSR